jgi:glycosyltransferase involved in cell wall biosynthesis
MKVAIIEPSIEVAGHHCVYARNIILGCLRREWSVCLGTCQGANTHPAIAELPASERGSVGIRYMPFVPFPLNPTPARLLRYQFAWFGVFREFYRAHLIRERPDVIYLVNLDYCDKAMAVKGSPFGDNPFAGMLMFANFHQTDVGLTSRPRRADLLRRLAFKRLLGINTLRSVLCLDEALLRFSSDRRIPGAEKLGYVPELASLETMGDRSVSRRMFEFREEDFVILVYGRLSPRKGIRHLIEAISGFASLGNVKLLLAGAPDDDTLRLLQSPAVARLRTAGRLVEILRPIEVSGEEETLFAASDAVWLGYSGHAGMSGVLVQAARAERPVIACNQGLIAWFAERHGLGELVDVDKPAEVAQSIERLAANPGLRQQYADAGRRVGATHTPENFSRVICNAICSSTA